MAEFDYSQVEERIRPHVRWFHSHGIETVSSCGHDMYVIIEWRLDALEKLCDLLRSEYDNDFMIEIAPQSGPPPYDYWVQVKLTGVHKGDGKPEDLILLKVEPDAHPLYFVLRERRYPPVSDSMFSAEESDRYFYDEHTCPTNWTGDIEAVISRGDPDPHGFATFVRRIPAPDDLQDHDDGQYLELFPETAGGDG